VTQRLTSIGTFFACALLSFTLTFSVLAQSTKWKEYNSEKGKFSVLLPSPPTTDYRLGDPDSGTGLFIPLKQKSPGLPATSKYAF
jgi:hypothetical protein